MNSKMTTNSQLPATEPKKQKRNKLRKQLEQEQNHRNGDHMEGYHQGGERIKEKVQGIRSINGRQEIVRGRLRIVWEVEKPKNVYVQSMDMN